MGSVTATQIVVFVGIAKPYEVLVIGSALSHIFLSQQENLKLVLGSLFSPEKNECFIPWWLEKRDMQEDVEFQNLVQVCEHVLVRNV